MPSGKHNTGVDPASSASAFLAQELAHRRDSLDRALRAAARADFSKPRSERTIHQLRVACRRAAAAIDAAEPLLGAKRLRSALKAIRAVRNAAGPVRDADVVLHWVEKARRTHPSERPGLQLLAGALRDTRKTALAELPEELKQARVKLGKRLGRLIDRLTGKPGADPSTISLIAGKVLERHADDVLAAAAGDLGQADQLHALRIECKRLRYAIEVFASALGKKPSRRLLTPLAEFQQRVGGFTDCSVRADRIADVLERIGPGRISAKPRGKSEAVASLKRVLRNQRAECRREHRAASAAWTSLHSSTLFDDLRRLVYPASNAPTAASIQPPAAAARARSDNGTISAAEIRKAAKPAPLPARRGKRRVAAIDIGTNSIRLIVGEADADGSYRVLDDEKEITRLGRGLHETGRLDPDTQEHSALTIARMKSIAQGYGATEIRVVATAACREARNADEFLRLVRDRSGLDVEVIPAEQEALLAYRSAANAFDLAGAPAAVVDMGGGSLEVVFSAGIGSADARGAGLGGGVIERVFSMPLGAVRLTEQFGGATAAAGKRHKELIRFVEATLRKQMGKPPFAAATIVGTGGTFTTLAGMLAHKEMGPAAQGLFSGSVQGREVRRSEIRHVLDHLRELNLRERARVPGLPADRADIIIAGLTAIDLLLKRLGANSVLVHEGGIRDGLLLTMVQNSGGGAEAAGRNNPLRGVMRFARACQYEAAHAKHVARLSLRIFDQLVDQSAHLPQPVAAALSPRDRVLLEAAAILHDVGYLVNYASHHKHSFHLIVHADLPGLTSREIKVVANVARYHRAAEPKDRHRNLADLNEPDRQRVRVLAGILRIADGLDRTHMQRVRDVQVRLTRGAAHFDVLAGEEPGVDIWGAIRKARLFEKTFGRLPHLEWRGPGAEPRRGAGEAVLPSESP